jgi:NTP pyrophosphatase (non-canonical NTP hydrolase)
MEVSKLIEMTRETTGLFDKAVGKWDISVMVTELMGEVGTLADSVMIREGYRPARNGEPIDLEDDIVDVMFMLMRIADHYDIDVESAYQEMIEKTQRKLKDRLHARS